MLVFNLFTSTQNRLSMFIISDDDNLRNVGVDQNVKTLIQDLLNKNVKKPKDK